MKKILITVVLLAALGYGVYWFGDRAGWFQDRGPTNLPTREERARMEEIETTSNSVAPNAKAGAGVVPRGTLPPAPTIIPEETEATSSTQTSDPEELP